MEEQIIVRVPPQKIWETWERAHALHGQTGIREGQQGKAKFRYQVLEVRKGEFFSILWKTLFVRLIFTYIVKPTQYGSQISYRVQIKGPFAWPIRWLLGEKIRENMSLALKATVRELET